jgi:hypothetical protein
MQHSSQRIITNMPQQFSHSLLLLLLLLFTQVVQQVSVMA